MLAYRHAFHAGNHADVLKHMLLAQVLDYVGEKDKPYWCIDTHAGAGGYALDAAYAQKHAEYAQGIGRLWARDDLPAPVARYVDLVRGFNPDGTLRHYPGSPELASALLRPQDRLRLFELHPTDFKLLDALMGQRKHTEVRQADGFAALKGQLPPPSRRAVVLIDPPYEIKKDYDHVVVAVREALKRFAECMLLIWYPVLKRPEPAELVRKLKPLAPKSWLHARLCVQPPAADGLGLQGSGMLLINPPWVLRESLANTLPWLTAALAQHEGAQWQLEHHTV